MAHVYASLAQFKAFLSGSDPGSSRDAAMLTTLSSASRAVDAFCARGSTFGPVIETRTFTVCDPLLLQADLTAFDTVTIDGNDVTPTDPLTGRTRGFTGFTGTSMELLGTWGYEVIVQPTDTLDDAVNDSVTVIPVHAGESFSPGNTIVIDDEQLSILSITADNLTVIRGANGTTAASHLDEAPVSVILYDDAAVDATLRVAVRRWKQRDAGVSGLYGGGELAATTPFDTEYSILRGTLGHLRFSLVA